MVLGAHGALGIGYGIFLDKLRLARIAKALLLISQHRELPPATREY